MSVRSSVLVVLFLLSVVHAEKINNLKPRLDINGEIMDAHDGTIRKFTKDGPYYYHAMSYGLCDEPPRYGCDSAPYGCGFHLDHNISIWKSYTLESGSWEYVGNAIEVSQRPKGILYRPHCVYNPITKMYVLWFNNVLQVANGYQYTVATSTSPEGPFVVQSEHANIGGGDFDIWVEEDGTAFLIRSDNAMIISQLTPDYLNTTNPSSPTFTFPLTFVEAPSIIKRNGYYYALFDWCCCYCYQGSGIQVWTAKNISGPWVQQQGGDLACRSNQTMSLVRGVDDVGGVATSAQGCQYVDEFTTSVTRSQQNFIVKVHGSKHGVEYLYTGDRWQQSPDGLKGHDPQYWYPLSFDDSVVPATILPVTWADDIQF